MVGQALGILDELGRMESLDGVGDARVEIEPPGRRDAGVGDVAGEHVTEGVFEFGKEPGRVEELAGLQQRQMLAEIRGVLVGDLLA